jgi:hypothetical protein
MKRVMAGLFMSMTMLAGAAAAQDASDWGAADWGLDPSVLATGGSDLLRRAPDAQVDGLFQAVHAATRDGAGAQAMCALFEPDADRSIAGLGAVAAQLDPDHRAQLGDAIAALVVAGLQARAQAVDRTLAQQALTRAAVTAGMLHDGFAAGLQAGDDPAGRAAHCQSLHWLLDAVQMRPPAERVAITRLLLDQGLAHLAGG